MNILIQQLKCIELLLCAQHLTIIISLSARADAVSWALSLSPYLRW